MWCKLFCDWLISSVFKAAIMIWLTNVSMFLYKGVIACHVELLQYIV